VKNIIFILSLVLSLTSFDLVHACSPYGTPFASHTIVGDNLNITVTNTSAWSCCFHFQLELICNAANFSGTANYGVGTSNANSPTVCKPNTANMAYTAYTIDISALCPGVTYKYRVRDKHTGYSYWSNWSAVYTFVVPGPDYVVNLEASPLLVCVPNCTTLTASSSNNCGPVTYTWNQGLAAGAVQTACPTVQTTYTVTGSVTVPLCPIPITQTASIVIDIDAPAVNGTVTAIPQTICQGESSFLSVTGYYGQLQWQSSDSPNGPFVDIPGATTDTYTFITDLTTETTYFRVHIYTCTDEYTLPVMVQVFDTPQANFNTSNICADASYVFQNTTVNVSPVTTWLWDFGNGSTSNQMNPNFFFNPGTYSVSLFAQNAAGCSDQIVQEITVFPIPNALFSVNNVCAQGSSEFVSLSNVIAPSTITSHQWDFSSNGSIDYQTVNVTHNYPNEGVNSVTLTVTTDHGCSHSYTGFATVYPNPVVNFNTSPVCLGNNTFFNDATQISNLFTNNNIVTWNWDFGDGNSSNSQNPSNLFTAAGNFNVSLSVVSNNGCTGSIMSPITVYPIPVASFVGNQLEGCSPVYPTITSTSTVAQPSSIINYHWQLSNGTSQNSNNNMFTTALFNNGNAALSYGLQLTVTTNHGCTNSLNVPNYINVYHNPVASFYYEPFYPNVLNSNVDFLNTSTNADSYFWNFAALGMSNEVNPSFTFPDEAAGEYYVFMIANTDEGCADTAYAIVQVQDVLIFYVPNTFTPDNDDYNQYFSPIISTGIVPNTYHLTIFDRWGEVMFESFDYEIGWDGTYGIGSTRIVPDGTYIWQISFRETMSDKRHLYRGHINVLR
jgi:gliding motility-associated-like protein